MAIYGKTLCSHVSDSHYVLVYSILPYYCKTIVRGLQQLGQQLQQPSDKSATSHTGEDPFCNFLPMLIIADVLLHCGTPLTT